MHAEPEQTPSVDAGSDDESVDQIAPSVASSQGTGKRRAGTPPTPSTRPAKRARVSVPQGRTYASPDKISSQKTVDRQTLPSQSARGSASRPPLSAGRTDAKRVNSGGSRASNVEVPSAPGTSPLFFVYARFYSEVSFCSPCVPKKSTAYDMAR